jgi:carboxyl-terminal processing protease
VDELKQALQDLTSRGMKGLVLDLRYNPGGLLSAAIAASDLFVSEGRIVSTKGRNTIDRAWDAQKADTFEGFPMAVLVNRFSASASEIVAACLQDHKRAVVVGERTWGKGSVQNIIELEQGRSALKLTTAGYQRPSGKNIHRFPGSEDDGEWGVAPNDGFLLELTPEQTEKLVEHQRRVLIVKPKVPENGADTDTPESEFVDPHLEKALSYLGSQLATEQNKDIAEEKPGEEEPGEEKTGQAAERKVETGPKFRAA